MNPKLARSYQVYCGVAFVALLLSDRSIPEALAGFVAFAATPALVYALLLKPLITIRRKSRSKNPQR